MSEQARYLGLATGVGWKDPWASDALEMVDALRSSDYVAMSAAGGRLRHALMATELGSDAIATVVALAVMRAQKVLAVAGGEPFSAYVLSCRLNAEQAKARDLFPWRLLDG